MTDMFDPGDSKRLQDFQEIFPDGWQEAGWISEDDAADWYRNSQGRVALGLGQDPSSIHWRDPQPRTLESQAVSVETIEMATGARLIPLCRRQIPAEGTE